MKLRRGCSSHERLVSERVRVHDPAQGIAEDVRVLAVVVPPFEFFEVTVKVLPADLRERGHDGAFEQAPDAQDPQGGVEAMPEADR